MKGLEIQWDTAGSLADDLREAGRTIVFTNGCFDIIHNGHIWLLQQAAKEGDVLFVGLNSDESVARLKGEIRPILTQKSRVAVLCGMEAVDFVVLFTEDTPLALVECINPHVIVKSTEYEKKDIAGADIVKGTGGRVVLVPVVDTVSTSGIVEKIREGG